MNTMKCHRYLLLVFFIGGCLLVFAPASRASAPHQAKQPPQDSAAAIQIGSNPGTSAWGGAWDSDPWEDFRNMSRMMNQMLVQAMPQTYTQNPAIQSGQNSAGMFNPDLDLRETPEAYIVEADIPGMDKSKINISVSQNILTISGTREQVENRDEETESGRYHFQGRSFGSFQRSFGLPGDVKEDSISAAYDQGVLKITLPKLEKDAPASERKIEVK